MGGGGNDNYEAQQAALEKQKQSARSKVNLLFGAGSSLDPANYTTNGTAGYSTGAGEDQNYVNGTPGAFDQSAFDTDTAALATNKAARDSLYQTVRDNAYTAGKRGLDENYEKAKRNNGFALFAQGLNGGSEDVDQNALLDRTYSNGLLDLGSKADAAKAQLASNDETARLGLLQSIDNGMDSTSAVSSAIAQMKNGADAAAASANGTSLGDLFATSGALYNTSQAAKGKAAGTDWWNNLSSGSGASTKTSGGTTTKTFG